MKRGLLIAALLATTVYAADGLRPNLQPPMPISTPKPTAPPLAPFPQGWTLMTGGGPHGVPGRCNAGLDTQTSADGPQLFSVLCSNPDIPSFGGAQRDFDSTRYQGQRVRVSAWLKVTGVEAVVGTRAGPKPSSGEAGLLLAVGSPTGGIQRDRMSLRTIKGSTAWEYRDYVADVPKDSRRLTVGFWMEGKGQLWVRDMQVEKVSKKVPLNFHQDDDPGFGLTLK